MYKERVESNNWYLYFSVFKINTFSSICISNSK